MSMDKLKKCRICLVENVRMYVVADKNLQETYEKLTDAPFVTEDSRPTLACVFCCSKLKQCYQLQRKCLEAEKLFAQMLNEDYETKPLINQDPLQFFSGFNITPTVHLSIVDVCQTESIAIKQELPAVCEGLDYIIEPKEEHQSDELEPEDFDNSCLDVADIKTHHSESDLEDDVPLMEFKIEVEEEQEVFKSKQRAWETTRITTLKTMETDEQMPSTSSTSMEAEDIVPSTSAVPFVVPHTTSTARTNAQRQRATVAKKPKQDTLRTKLEDAITDERTGKEKSDLKVIQITQKRRSFNPVKKIIQNTRTEIGKYPYKCDVCQHTFSKKCNLTNHIRKHTGEKPYKCDVCQRSFSVKSNLSQHNIRKHTGEKPYKCEVCQRCFSRKCDLTEHIRIHTGEKPFMCDVCQRNFSQKRSLLGHMRIHTGEKPYKCDLCQRSFSQKCYLTEHIQTHTGGKSFKCDICERSFSRFRNLKRHILIHTGKKT